MQKRLQEEGLTKMDKDIQVIVLVVLGAIIVFLVVILILIQFGVLGHKKICNNMKICVNGGLNIDGLGGRTSDIGLKGFCEDYSGTLLTRLGRRENMQLCLTNVESGLRYITHINNQVTIGRKNIERLSDFLEILEEPSISKRHLVVSRIGDRLYVQDIGSSNHTWVNGCMVEYSVEIHTGDILRIGRGEFIVEISCQH